MQMYQTFVEREYVWQSVAEKIIFNQSIICFSEHRSHIFGMFFRTATDHILQNTGVVHFKVALAAAQASVWPLHCEFWHAHDLAASRSGLVRSSASCAH